MIAQNKKQKGTMVWMEKSVKRLGELTCHPQAVLL